MFNLFPSGLKVLHCQHTFVSALPAGIHELQFLEDIQAHHCRLQTIDGRLGLLQHLRVLNCTSNPIWSPPEDALSLDTPDLKRVLAALALTQPAHAVTSHIMFVLQSQLPPKTVSSHSTVQVPQPKVPIAWSVMGCRDWANGRDS